MSASGAGECSGFQGLLLPGLDNSPPYILALLPLPAGAASSVSAAPTAGGAEESSGSGSSSGGASARYELQATAHPQPPTFMMLAAD